MQKLQKHGKEYIFPAILTVVLVLLDQITKYLADAALKGTAGIPIIKDVFELQYLENTSAAFSLDPITLIHKIFSIQAFDNPQIFLRTKMIFFVILTMIVVCLLIWLFCKIPNNKRFLPMNITLVFFISGAIGNCIDRIWHNYVIDFLYFKLIHFPVFNVADIYVTLSAIAFFILFLFYYKEEDFQVVFPKKQERVS